MWGWGVQASETEARRLDRGWTVAGVGHGWGRLPTGGAAGKVTGSWCRCQKCSSPVPAAAEGHLCLGISFSVSACVSQCPCMSLSVPACLPGSHVSLSVPMCLPVSPCVSQGPCVSPSAPACLPGSSCVSQCPHVSPRVPTSLPVSPHVSQGPHVSLSVSTCLPGSPCVSQGPCVSPVSQVSFSVPTCLPVSPPVS